MSAEAIPQDLALRVQLGMFAGHEPAGGLLECRYKRTDGRGMGQCFHPADRYATFVETVARLGQGTDAYLACAPRRARRGREQDIARSWVLWADCDSAASVQALEACEPAPTMVILSGSMDGDTPSRHAYWSLREPLAAQHVKRANRRIAHALGADLAATDVARVLRPAGTVNFKHEPPQPVQCVRLEIDQYSAAEVVGQLADPPAPVQPVRAPSAPRASAGDPLLSIPAVEFVPALTGRLVNRDGYVTCPFHGGGEERTPSLYVRCSEPTRWKCFGCDESRGDIIAFGARLFGIDPAEPGPRGTPGAGYHRIRERLAADLLGAQEAA